MITNNSIRNLIEQQVKEYNMNIQVSLKAIKYLKKIIEGTIYNILEDTLKWETNNRLTERNIRTTMNKYSKRASFLYTEKTQEMA